MGKKREDFTVCMSIAGGVIALMTLLPGAGTVHAVSVLNSCSTYCHGAPPRDAIRKSNPHFGSQSSAFPGNHGNHLTAAPSASACGICHVPVSAADFGHQNNVIGMANSIKGYSSALLRAKYDKGVFFNQTSIPNLTNARCSNVNCHFERQTPLWGTAASATTCATCHDAIPATLSHPKHTAITACSTCHADHGLDAKPFMHATSAGRAIVVKGSYTGSNNRYLPSQATGRILGSCTTAYCHSSVQSVTGGAPPVYKPVTWGAAAMTCASCHGNTAATLTSGSHAVHLNAAYSFVCGDCHGAAGAGNTASHANQAINIDLTLNRGISATYSGDSIAQNSNFGVCNNSTCHGKNSATWGGTSSTTLCTKCHGQANFAYANLSAAQIAPGGTGVDTGGNSVDTSPRVGTHQGHLLGSSNISGAVLCGECHITVATVQGAAHLNYTTATITFRGRAVAASHTPTATRVGGLINCNNTYCHTGNRVGATATFTTPVWNNTALLGNTSIADTCTNKCHGMPPGAGVTGDTHQGNVAVTTIAGLSACSSQSPATGCHPNINAAPTTMANIWFNKLLHINGSVDGGTCVGCHSKAITRTKGRPGKTLAAVSTEFGLAWGHKKTGRSAVTDADCIVCHLEGVQSTGKPSATYHQDGNIDLRDPDGAGETPITNISGAAFTFQRFSTSYAAGTRTSTGHTLNTIDNVITQKFCLKCHDSTGATNTTARSGVAPTQYLPFGTGSQNGAAYTVGLSAGVVGGVVDVDSMFLTTNSTFHPVKGPQNNRYASGTRMAVPYGVTKTAIADGIVMNCFDCHNAPAPLTLRTVAAHGSTAPNAYRGTVYDTTNTLCKVCHAGYTGTTSHHGTGSAFASNTNSGMTTYLTNQCQRCHASTNTAVRPVRAEDAHGFNRFAGTGTDAMWPRGATETYRPYAFMRNTTQWTTTSWKPLSGPGVPTGSATCGGSMSASGCGDNMTTYTPGGTY